MNIGPTIQKLRKQKGLNQADFKELTGLSQTALSQIERGIRTPHKANLTKICEVLKVPEHVLYLLSFDVEDVPDDKKERFKMLYPSAKDLMIKIFYEENEN